MRYTYLQVIKDQFWKVEPVVRADLTGKTIVIVGANVGLGFEAAKHFASMNPRRLVLGCRSPEKGQAAVQGKYNAHDWTGLDWTNLMILGSNDVQLY
jgi:NAD(P)-dependent dehydrogenase (short-subunit alcohol dehydrogenase family)